MDTKASSTSKLVTRNLKGFRNNFDIVILQFSFSPAGKSSHTPVFCLVIWPLLWGGFGDILLAGSGRAGEKGVFSINKALTALSVLKLREKLLGPPPMRS